MRFLARRFGFARERVALSLAVHVAGSVLASLAEIVLFGAASAAIRELRFGAGSLREELSSSFLFKFHTGVVTYWTAALGFLVWEYALRSRVEDVRRAELERSLAEAQLGALQAQLAPHFLFNTLHAISAKLRDDPDGAERMLARLGELLRAVLARRDRPARTLEEELAFLDGYLELQRGRFGARLSNEKRIDPAALDASVPSFLLLPLVENALQHGIGARPGPGRLCITAARRDGRVEIAIEDDGAGLARERDGYARSGLASRARASACGSCTATPVASSSCPASRAVPRCVSPFPRRVRWSPDWNPSASSWPTTSRPRSRSCARCSRA